MSLTFLFTYAYNDREKGGESKHMSVKFYDVKLRKEVHLEEKAVSKVEYKRETKAGKTQVRYALRGKTADGRNLTKFVSKVDYDKMK